MQIATHVMCYMRVKHLHNQLNFDMKLNKLIILIANMVLYGITCMLLMQRQWQRIIKVVDKREISVMNIIHSVQKSINKNSSIKLK